ncbi:MAG: endolytic transglycosylase MltG [Parvibaculales bacterium]
MSASGPIPDLPPEPTRPISRVRAYLALFLFAAIAGVLVLAWGVSRFQAPGPHQESQRIIVPKGSGLGQVAAVLEARGLVHNSLIFRLAMRFRGSTLRVQAGEYEVPARASMAQIARLLESGAVLLHDITIPEGLTSQQIIDLLMAMPVLVGAVELPPEGSLLPETYRVERGMTRAALVTKMQAAQTRLLADLWPKRLDALPLKTPQEAVILASIVEKETGLVSERKQVAAVFINRLNRNMRLQSDPTIIYGLVGGKGVLGRPIRRSEIRRETPYNTYRIKGLPPTPIANPGAAALAAVLQPADSDALYFVADGTGGHVFARDLAGHNRNVAKWRQIQRQQGLR